VARLSTCHLPLATQRGRGLRRDAALEQLVRDPLRAAGEELAAKFLPPGLFVDPGAQQLEIDREPLARRLVDIAPVARPSRGSGLGTRGSGLVNKNSSFPSPQSRVPSPFRLTHEPRVPSPESRYFGQSRFFRQLEKLALLAVRGGDHLERVAARDGRVERGVDL